MRKKTSNGKCEQMAYRFYGIPSKQDAAQEDKTFGCCRYLWNRMLGDHNTLYSEIGEVPANTPADYKDLDDWILHSAAFSKRLPAIRTSNPENSQKSLIQQMQSI